MQLSAKDLSIMCQVIHSSIPPRTHIKSPFNNITSEEWYGILMAFVLASFMSAWHKLKFYVSWSHLRGGNLN